VAADASRDLEKVAREAMAMMMDRRPRGKIDNTIWLTDLTNFGRKRADFWRISVPSLRIASRTARVSPSDSKLKRNPG